DITRRNFLHTAASGAAAALTVGAAAPAGADDGVTFRKDVVFGKGGDIELKLDVLRPSAAKNKRTATIHFHGGGFVGGNKGVLADRIRPYADLGYVAIAAQYRLSGQAGFPALIHDAKAAIRWVRANAADLDIDPHRIAVVGYSAGGYHAIFT